MVDTQVKAAKAAAGSTTAVPNAVVEEAQRALENLRAATK